MKQNIIAIGGGSFKNNKTLSIDQEIIRASGVVQPRLLFIPTASSDDISYAQAVMEHFTKLGCVVDVLYLIRENPTAQEIERKILSAQIIYVGGGNTLKMMRRWRFLKIDQLLEKARRQGSVLCGVSAGSICWFKHGNSDSRKYTNPDANYIKVAGLGFINALHCPHYDTESDRQHSLEIMMRSYPGICIALEDYAALQIDGNMYRIISSIDTANAYKIYYLRGQLHKYILEKNNNFKPITDITDI